MKVEVESYTKSIKGAVVLDRVSCSFESGVCYGLNGKNGSGKTMLLRAVAGLIFPSSGRVTFDGKVLGRDVSFPDSMGLLIESPSFIPRYTGLKNLELLASLRNKASEADIKAALESVGLDPADKRHYRKYSLGMKQRLGIACAFMESPDLILLDEPINALDPSGVECVERLVHKAKERGAIVVVACHDADELRVLADEIITMAEGRIIKRSEVRHE